MSVERLADEARGLFERTFGTAPSHLFQAPGRVNLIGEHTDYNDGFVLPCAIDRQTVVAIGPASDGHVHSITTAAPDGDRFVPALPLEHATAEWADYVRGVAAELMAAGHEVAPARLAIAGDVPVGAGLSSSASLEVATALALLAATGDALPLEKVAALCQRAENRFVGCACGIMDQFAAALGKAGHALLLDCRTLEWRAVRLPDGCAVLVIDSGVRHAHASGEYNVRRAQCDAAAAHYGVAALRDLDEAALMEGAAGLDDTSYRRARHVVTENARVLQAGEALERGDLAAMGALMAESHRSMRDDFEITVPPIDQLVALADEVIQGRGGARMTGGGFGGCVVALVSHDLVGAVEAHIARNYRTTEGGPASVFICMPSDGGSALG